MNMKAETRIDRIDLPNGSQLTATASQTIHSGWLNGNLVAICRNSDGSTDWVHIIGDSGSTIHMYPGLE